MLPVYWAWLLKTIEMQTYDSDSDLSLTRVICLVTQTETQVTVYSDSNSSVCNSNKEAK